MSGTTTLGGLISGLDTTQLIEDLMSIERRPLTKLESRISELEEQQDTFDTVESNLLTLKSRVANLKNLDTFLTFNVSSDDEEALSVTATSQASPGTHKLTILSLAQERKLSSVSFSDNDTSLGFSGEILLNGEVLTISAGDSLIDVRNAVNSLDAGVNASILTIEEGDNRLILSAEETGVGGFYISNASSENLLGSFGFTDGNKSIRLVESGAALSYEMASRSASVGNLLDLSESPPATVTINNEEITISLAEDSLNSLNERFNAIDGITTSVTSRTVGSELHYRLEVSGLDSFEDSSNILETLGILEGDVNAVAQVFTSTQTLTNELPNQTVDEHTLFHHVSGVTYKNGETITISGTDHESNAVSDTFTVSENSRVSDLLSQIESAFGGTVDAAFSDGVLTVTDATGGVSELSVSVTSSNTSSPLNIGNLNQTTQGRLRELQAGADSLVRIHNMEVSRSSNTITDLITGLDITLKSEDEENPVTITVSRDLDSVEEEIQEFIAEYNSVISYINENARYNRETGEAGILLGDYTANMITQNLRSIIYRQTGLQENTIRRLFAIGVTTTRDGTLEIDSTTLRNSLEDSFDEVVNLFTPARITNDGDISAVYHTANTNEGTYSVRITQAPEKAVLTAGSVPDDGIDEDGTLTIRTENDIYMSVNLESGDTADIIVDKLNEAFLQEETRILQSSVGLTGYDGTPVVETTTFSQIPAFSELWIGAESQNEKSMEITGTTRDGDAVNETVTLNSDDTVRDFLNAVADIFDEEVILSLDDEGRILVEDLEIGTSELSIGGMSPLGIDVFELASHGRYTLSIQASSENGNIRIEHESYGSNYTLEVIEGGHLIDFEETLVAGVDVEGVIGGEQATGNGNILTGNADQENVAGLVLQVNLTPEELIEEGEFQGQVTVSTGIGSFLYNVVNSYTEYVTGSIPRRQQGLTDSIERLNDRIDRMEETLSKKRESLVRKFTEMEKALSMLQALNTRLGSAMGYSTTETGSTLYG